jgi:hypothetical protein
VATAEDMFDATQRKEWSKTRYVYLTPDRETYARQYYVDYPLLFNNVCGGESGCPSKRLQGQSALAYATPVGKEDDANGSCAGAAYIVSTSSSKTPKVRANGSQPVATTTAPDGVTGEYVSNSTVACQIHIDDHDGDDDRDATLYKLKRSVFLK